MKSVAGRAFRNADRWWGGRPSYLVWLQTDLHNRHTGTRRLARFVSSCFNGIL